jgi:hypothetical protein
MSDKSKVHNKSVPIPFLNASLSFSVSTSLIINRNFPPLYKNAAKEYERTEMAEDEK